MAVRSVLGKLGRSRFIHNNERLIMAGSSPTVCSPPHHPFDYYGVVHDQNKADQKRNPFLHGSLMKKVYINYVSYFLHIHCNSIQISSVDRLMIQFTASLFSFGFWRTRTCSFRHRRVEEEKGFFFYFFLIFL